MNITQKDGLTLDISDGVTLSQDAPEALMDEEQGFPSDSEVQRKPPVQRPTRVHPSAGTHPWSAQLYAGVCAWERPHQAAGVSCHSSSWGCSKSDTLSDKRWESQRGLISDIQMSALSLQCLTTDVKRECNTLYDPQRAARIITRQMSIVASILGNTNLVNIH